MKIDTVEKFYTKQLADLYSAESQLCEALPRMVAAATDARLKLAFQDQLEQTVGQRDRLGTLLAEMNCGWASEVCAAMRELIEDSDVLIDEAGDSHVLDSGLIAAAQRVERYEIAAYGLVIEFARVLGREDDLPLLERSLGEEKGANILLTRIAASPVSQAAAA